MGLLLYRNGTVCYRSGYFSFKAADAICKEMNFTRAKRWTTKESFDIQSDYEINLRSGSCGRAEWRSCRFSEKPKYCEHSEDVFLSCTGS